MKLSEQKAAKILFVDIETSPNLGYFWRPGREISVDYNCIVKERAVICLSYLWSGTNEVKSLTWDSKQDDAKLLKSFAKIASEANIIIGHNGDRFDIPWLKGRMMMQGLEPLINLVSIDTLKLSRNNFNLNSHKLDYLAKIMGFEGKISTGWALWKSVLEGDKKSLDLMVKYCNNDTKILAKVFFKMLPYIKKLPVNFSYLLKGNKLGCPNCGHEDAIKYGTYVSALTKKQRYRCNNCYHYYAGETINEKSNQHKKGSQNIRK